MEAHSIWSQSLVVEQSLTNQKSNDEVVRCATLKCVGLELRNIDKPRLKRSDFVRLKFKSPTTIVLEEFKNKLKCFVSKEARSRV